MHEAHGHFLIRYKLELECFDDYDIFSVLHMRESKNPISVYEALLCRFPQNGAAPGVWRELFAFFF